MPTFYPETNAAAPFDDPQRALEKILAVTLTLGAGGAVDYATGGNYSGNGSPNGVVTANKGAIYTQLDAPGTFWLKQTDGTNTGWV